MDKASKKLIPVFDDELPEGDFWQTPPEVLKAVQSFVDSYGTMPEGQRFYDPCPSDPLVDGLKADWEEKLQSSSEVAGGRTIYLNPPYSKGRLCKWIDKGVTEYNLAKERNRYHHQIWLVNYSNSLTLKPLKQAASAICDLYQRVHFIRPGETERNKDDHPKYNNAIYYIGRDKERFGYCFRHLGEIYQTPGPV